MNTRKQAIEALINEAKKHGQQGQEAMLYDALTRITDTNLFAMFYEVFGHAVGETVVL